MRHSSKKRHTLVVSFKQRFSRHIELTQELLAFVLQAYVEKHIVKNYFYYYLFRFSAALGQEVFYITFLPFTHWNIDPYLSRRLVMIWVVSILFSLLLSYHSHI